MLPKTKGKDRRISQLLLQQSQDPVVEDNDQVRHNLSRKKEALLKAKQQNQAGKGRRACPVELLVQVVQRQR